MAKVAVALACLFMLSAGECNAIPSVTAESEQVKDMGEMSTFTSENKELTMSYPKNWLVEKPTDKLHVVKFKAPYPGLVVTVSKQRFNKPIKLSKYTSGIIALEIKNGAKKRWLVKVVSSKPSGTISGIPCYSSTLSYDMPPPVKHSFVTEVTATKGVDCYNVILMSMDAFHEPYKAVFNEMLKSIRIK
jgi:hypothetical protein